MTPAGPPGRAGVARRLEIEGREVWFRWLHRARGPAPPVVLLHAGLTSSRAWDRLGEAIGSRCEHSVVAYDRPGYHAGQPIPAWEPDFLEQEAVLLEGVLEALVGGRAHLVGHSDGGTIALLHAARRPAAVESLVLVGVHTFTEELTLSSIARLAEECAAGRTPPWLDRLHGSRGPDLVRAWAGVWLAPRRAGWDVRDRIRGARAPTLVVQGTEDAYGTLRQVDAVVERVPDTRTWIVEGCGHGPHAERPDAFVDRVVALVREASGPDSGPGRGAGT